MGVALWPHLPGHISKDIVKKLAGGIVKERDIEEKTQKID